MTPLRFDADVADAFADRVQRGGGHRGQEGLDAAQEVEVVVDAGRPSSGSGSRRRTQGADAGIDAVRRRDRGRDVGCHASAR